MSTKICGSLNNGCSFLGLFGYCGASDSFCEDQIGYQSTDELVVTRYIMRNLRTLHQENIEIKKLLSEIIKQNQK